MDRLKELPLNSLFSREHSDFRLTHLQQFMLMFRCKPLILLVWISSVLKM